MLASNYIKYFLIYVISLMFPSIGLAALPSMTDSPITVQINDNNKTRTYKLYRDFDGEQILYVEPQELRIALDNQGKPICNIVLISDLNNPNATNNIVASGGWLYLQAKVGYNDQDAVFQKIRDALKQNEPEFKNYKLTALGFRPDSASLSVELAGGINFKNRYIEVPTGATTVIGGTVTAMIPLTTEHAGQISESVLGGGGGNNLGVALHYKADALYGVRPAKITVKVNKTESFNYFQEKKKASAGFWIFSYSKEQTKIREDFKSQSLVKTEIDFGDPALNAKQELLQEIAEKYENAMIDKILNLSIDRTTTTPSAEPKIKEGYATVFSPASYWSYGSYFAGAYGSVTIDKTLEATAERSQTIKQSFIRSIRLDSDMSFNIDPSKIQTVHLENTFDKSESIQIANFPNGIEEFKNNIVSVNIEGSSPKGNSLKWYFDKNQEGDAEEIFHREAKFKRVEHKINNNSFFTYESVINDPIETTATLKTNTYTVISKQKLSRSPDRFDPVRANLSDYFSQFKIDGTLLFERLGDAFGPVTVSGKFHATKNNQSFVFNLTPQKPIATFYYAQGDVFGDDSFLQFKLIDGINANEYGEKIKVESSPSDSFDVAIKQIGGLEKYETLLVSGEDLFYFQNQASKKFKIKGRIKIAKTGGIQHFTLSPDTPSVSIKYDKKEGFGEGSSLQFKVFNVLKDYDWGSDVSIESHPTDQHDIIGSELGGFKEFFEM